MADSPPLKIINSSTTRPALDIDDRAQGGNIVVVKRNRAPVVWVDADGVLNCASAIVAPGSGGGGGGGTTFEYAGSEDGSAIWDDITTALGVNDGNQNDMFRLAVSVSDGTEIWRIYRENAEGWGIGFDRVLGTNSVPQAGTYTVLGLWVTNV